MQDSAAVRTVSQVFIWMISLTGSAIAEPISVALTDTTRIEFIDAEKSGVLLKFQDDFLSSSSALDRQLRMRSVAAVSKDQYLDFIGQQTRDWTEPERDKLNSIVESISTQLSRYRLGLPKTIWLVKTNGKEEGGAAYCRGSSTIVLPERMLEAPAARLQSTLTHEIFHILSRQDKTLRDRMYATLGFQRIKCRLLVPLFIGQWPKTL